MSAWQFEGTVCYQSGKRVPHAAVALGSPQTHADAAGSGASSGTAVFRTSTDLTGRFQATLREAPSNGGSAALARAFDSWRSSHSEWTPVSRSGNTLSANLVLPWDGPDVCNLNGQWHNTAGPFVEGLLHQLEKSGPMHKALSLRLYPVQEDGSLDESYPRDPAMERMFAQFLDEVSHAKHSHAAKDIARRISDCLLRMGFAKRFDERIDVFRFALQGLMSRPKDDRKTHIRNLLKTLSMSMKRPFVPGNGAIVELESSTATIAIVLFAGAHLSLGRTDLQLKKESPSAARVVFQVGVPTKQQA